MTKNTASADCATLPCKNSDELNYLRFERDSFFSQQSRVVSLGSDMSANLSEASDEGQ